MTTIATPARRTGAAPVLPAEAAPVQLINATQAAAIGSMSKSWWLDAVREGTAPQPTFRAPRATRWRLADVVAFWRSYQPPAEVTDRMLSAAAGAAKKSAAAKRARRARAGGGA